MNARETPVPRPITPLGVRLLTIAVDDLMPLLTGRFRLEGPSLPADCFVLDFERDEVPNSIILYVASTAFPPAPTPGSIPDIGPCVIDRRDAGQ